MFLFIIIVLISIFIYFTRKSIAFAFAADKVELPSGQMPTKDNKPSVKDIALMDAVNKHRASLNLPIIPISDDAWLVAASHNWDLSNNNTGWSGRGQTGCSSHSWSNQPGKWTGCCYELTSPNGNCMWSKPKEIAGNSMKGYEIGSGGKFNPTPDGALQMWLKSAPHRAVIENTDIWKNIPWKGFGCSLHEGQQGCWFLN